MKKQWNYFYLSFFNLVIGIARSYRGCATLSLLDLARVSLLVRVSDGRPGFESRISAEHSSRNRGRLRVKNQNPLKLDTSYSICSVLPVAKQAHEARNEEKY